MYSARIDNLLMSFITLEAFLQDASEATLAASRGVHLMALFDNEEVGSDSAYGAGSNLLEVTLERIYESSGFPVRATNSEAYSHL